MPHSSLLQGLATSRFRDLLRQRLLMHCQDTTVLRYFGSISRFLLTASDLDIDLSSIAQLQVVDVMFSLATSGDDDAAPDTLELPHNMLKALRWMVRTFSLDNFPPLVGPLFDSVLAFSAKDRREAPPLALDFVLYLEQLVLRSGTPSMERIWAGSFLVCIWSSLRFSDAQHVRWSSVNAASDASVLRGISYRTKTGTRGTPFALGGCGLSASKGTVSWISVWLRCLQQVWDCLRGADAAVEPDCLFFRCDLAARTFEPLSYTQCLSVFRTYFWLGTHDSGKYSSHCLVSSDVSVDALVSTYSLHSCKATVLSWLAQLDERPDVRLAQGHHSNPLLQSMTLYSRDSVFPALQAQSSWILTLYMPQMALVVCALSQAGVQ